MSDLNLTSFNPLYPMRIHPYKELLNDSNVNVMDKVNAVIDYLNQVGKLTNDVVKDWNTVYQWVMNDGLTTDVNNKLELMLANHEFDPIMNNILTKIGDLTTLQTVDKDTLVHAINDLVTEIGSLSSLQTSDQTSIVNAINANVASLAQIVQQTINVMNPPVPLVAAKGDGSSDDSTAINNIIASLTTGTVILPPRTFAISSPIKINDKSNVAIIGQGATLKVTTNSSDAVWINNTTFQQNIKLEGFNILYPVGSSSSTGKGIVINPSGSVNTTRITIKNIRIDNPKNGIYSNGNPLWFCDFEDIQVYGASDTSFYLCGGSTSNRLATISLKRVYLNTKNGSGTGATTTAPAFVIKYGYHIFMEACQADYAVKFGDFSVRGLTILDGGAEGCWVGSLSANDWFCNFANDQQNSINVDWMTKIENFHVNVDPNFTTNYGSDGNVRYFFQCATPLKVSGLRFNGGTTGSEETLTMTNNLHLIYTTGNFVHFIENVLYTWQAGGTINVNAGTAYLRNVTSKITNILGAVVNDGIASSSAYQSASQTVSATTWTKIQFQTVVKDKNSNYDGVTNYRFTAKTPGTYAVSAGVGCSNNQSGNRVIVALYKNGAEHNYLTARYSGAAGASVETGSTFVELAANDYLEIWIYSGVGLSIDALQTKTFFKVAKIA